MDTYSINHRDGKKVAGMVNVNCLLCAARISRFVLEWAVQDLSVLDSLRCYRQVCSVEGIVFLFLRIFLL